LSDAARPAVSRAWWLARAALVGAGVFSCRLGTANPLLVISGVAAWRAWRRGELTGKPRARVLAPPLIAFTVITIAGVAFSFDPLVSVGLLPRLLLFLVVPLAAALVDMRWWRWLIAGLAGMCTIMGAWGIVQYVSAGNDPGLRIAGPMSSYMTYAGWLMVVVLLLWAELVLHPRGRWWYLLPAALVGSTALVLSYTRSAWVGLVLGLLMLAAVWQRRLLLLYPLLAVLIWLAVPRAVLDRALSIFDLQQHANYDRVCMMLSGIEMIRDHPWTGVGLDMVRRVYPLYRRDDAPRWRTPHLHNNVLQIAAERGLLALGAYLWLLGAFLAATWRGLPHLSGGARAAVAGTLIAMVGTTTAGFFEYNFWDAEIQYLMLILMGAGIGRVEEATP
jgi:putative inorganic carbon (hco3(-)) transporter